MSMDVYQIGYGGLVCNVAFPGHTHFLLLLVFKRFSYKFKAVTLLLLIICCVLFLVAPIQLYAGV